MHDKSVDGLRGLAALNVVFAHFIGSFFPGTFLIGSFLPILNLGADWKRVSGDSFAPYLNILISPLVNVFYGGRFAVLIFFVLSGYVLSSPYFHENGFNKLRRRMFGRYIRLNIPIAASVAISFFVYRSELYFNIPAASLTDSGAWLAQFFGAGVSLNHAVKMAVYESVFFGSGLLNPPLWTMKIEFIGSIYLLTYYIIKPAIKEFISFILVVIMLYSFTGDDSIYFIAIFSGALLNKIRINATYNAPLFTIGLFFGAAQMQSVIFYVLPDAGLLNHVFWAKENFYTAIGGWMVSLAVINGFGKSFLQNGMCQKLGEISFPLYLVHFIILCSVSCAIYIFLPRNSMFITINFCVYIIACLCAAAFFVNIDKPAVNLAHRLTASW